MDNKIPLFKRMTLPKRKWVQLPNGKWYSRKWEPGELEETAHLFRKLGYDCY